MKKIILIFFLVFVACQSIHQPEIILFTAENFSWGNCCFDLKWETTFSDIVNIDPNIGYVKQSGIKSVSWPKDDTVFTIYAKNSSGECIRDILVKGWTR